jgi:predicted ATPase
VYHVGVIRRLYINNFRCLQNFDLPIVGMPSALLIGKNGAGKSTIVAALEVLQKIARGTNRVGELIKPTDMTQGQTGSPVRFEIEVELKSGVYTYSISFELPTGSKELCVLDESLKWNGDSAYSRVGKQIESQEFRNGEISLGSFSIDSHLVALPIFQFDLVGAFANSFKQWLAQMLLLRPIPALIRGDSEGETLQPNHHLTDLGAWFTGLLTQAPSAYTKVYDYLRPLMPDLKDIRNPQVGADARSLFFQFATDSGTITIPFDGLSDGEKCFVICALVLAANASYGPLLCFWDEPDNYLSLDEVSQFIMAIRREFQQSGQFIATSHNPEAIRRFSKENTIALYRKSHMEPTIARTLDKMDIQGDLIGSLISGDLWP